MCWRNSTPEIDHRQYLCVDQCGATHGAAAVYVLISLYTSKQLSSQFPTLLLNKCYKWLNKLGKRTAISLVGTCIAIASGPVSILLLNQHQSLIHLGDWGVILG